jgi:hypothetical protein
MSTLMTPGERRTLSTVVRQRMKVLRADVKLRRLELVAEAEKRLVERYADHDKLVADVGWRIGQIMDQANKDLRALIERVNADNPEAGLRISRDFVAPNVRHSQEDRSQLHRALIAGIDAQVEAANLDLDRREADLLQTLALESLETDAAKAFLQSIPSVAELVPSARLREIESAFDSRGAS